MSISMTSTGLSSKCPIWVKFCGRETGEGCEDNDPAGPAWGWPGAVHVLTAEPRPVCRSIWLLIFMAGLPSDERQIIHPVIAHSNSHLGLSQVLGNVFPDTATFSLHEGFDGSAGNSFKPRQLCPMMSVSQWDALSSSGAWSRWDGAERGWGSPRGTGNNLREAIGSVWAPK